jgi:hypothetical protein
VYKVAVCLTSWGEGESPSAFEFDLVYDPALNTCENESCPTGTCFDDNPDANLGTTTFSTTTLGPDANWDCNLSDVHEPLCDKGGTMGRAHLRCLCSPLGCGTLPVGADVSAPLAVVNLKASAVGVDTMKLENAHVFAFEGMNILDCTIGDADECYDATLFVQAPVGGIAEAPLTEADVLADERASSVPNSLALAALAALGALLVAAGAWYARRRRRAG